jgi:hypothetical protein
LSLNVADSRRITAAALPSRDIQSRSSIDFRIVMVGRAISVSNSILSLIAAIWPSEFKSEVQLYD